MKRGLKMRLQIMGKDQHEWPIIELDALMHNDEVDYETYVALVSDSINNDKDSQLLEDAELNVDNIVTLPFFTHLTAREILDRTGVFAKRYNEATFYFEKEEVQTVLKKVYKTKLENDKPYELPMTGKVTLDNVELPCIILFNSFTSPKIRTAGHITELYIEGQYGNLILEQTNMELDFIGSIR